MVSLAGLSAAFPGYQEAQKLGDRHKLDQAALTDIDLNRQSEVLAGRAMAGLIPGAQPMSMFGMPGAGGPAPGGAPQSPPMMGGAPPPMRPGQPSVPMQQGPPMPSPQMPAQGPVGDRFPAISMGAGDQRLSQALANPPPGTMMNPGRPPLMQGPPPMGGQQPPGGPPAGAQGVPPMGMPPGPLGLDQAIAAIRRQNPDAPPELQFRALNKLAPLLRMDDRNMLMYLNTLQRQQQLGQRGQELEEKKRHNLVGESQADQRLAQGETRIAQNQQRIINQQTGAQPSISIDNAKQLAERWLSGDKSVIQGFGSSKVGQANRALIMDTAMDIARERGMTLPQQLDAITGMAGRQAASQTAGRISAYIDQAAVSFESLLPIVEDAFKQVQEKNLRTQYPTINAFLQASDEQLGDPNMVALRSAVQGAINEYAQVMNRGRGQTTVYSQKRAEHVLNTAWNSGQFKASIDVLKKEVEAVRSASEKLVSRYKVPEAGGAAPTEKKPAPTSEGWSVEPVK